MGFSECRETEDYLPFCDGKLSISNLRKGLKTHADIYPDTKTNDSQAWWRHALKPALSKF